MTVNSVYVCYAFYFLFIMKLFFIFFLFFTMNTVLVFDFSKNSNISDWVIVDDVVMGGQSEGKFALDEEGNGVFSGAVSTANYGGFSSVRFQFNKINTDSNSKIVVRFKGDGKAYQLRIKDKVSNYFSYITTFQTNGEWQTLSINMKDMYPSFRGRDLDLPNYNSPAFEELVFLIGNKKNEAFQLIIDKIEIQ